MLTIEPSYKVLQQLLMTDEKYHFISFKAAFTAVLASCSIDLALRTYSMWWFSYSRCRIIAHKYDSRLCWEVSFSHTIGTRLCGATNFVRICPDNLYGQKTEVSLACVNCWVSDSAVTGSESVPVCSGRTRLCTGLYRNHNLGPHSSTTALQIQVWMRSTALLPRCFLPQMWMWDASFSPPWGKCYVQRGRIEPRPAPSPPALHPTSAHKHMHEEWSRTRFHL